MLWRFAVSLATFHILFLKHRTVTRTQFLKDSNQEMKMYRQFVYTICRNVDLTISKYIQSASRFSHSAPINEHLVFLGEEDCGSECNCGL